MRAKGELLRDIPILTLGLTMVSTLSLMTLARTFGSQDYESQEWKQYIGRVLLHRKQR